MTTTGPRTARSRFAPPPRAWRRGPRWQNSRPAKRVAGSKTASRKIFSAPSKTRLETASQALGTHQENYCWAYDFASGCVVAPNSVTGGQQSAPVSQATVVDPATGMIGQCNSAACGPTAAWNAAVKVGGAKVITQQNQVLYDKLSEAALKNGGTSLSQTAAAFNQFASGTSYRATLSYSRNLETMTDNLVNGTNMFIGTTRFDGINHIQLYDPSGGGQVNVFSSGQLNGQPILYNWSQDNSSTWSDIYRSQTGPTYQVIVIE